MTSSNRSSLALAVSLALGTGTVAPQLLAAPATADAPAPGLEEVVVTARKREESLRDVSAAISVVGGDQLRNGVINDVRDLQNIAPEITVGEVVGLMKITMRGLGNTSNARGEDAEVAFYVDGAVVARQEAQSMAMFDLDRVEVLRGPQGTLYGRNSTGGTLNLITKRPTRNLDGYVNLTSGNYNLMKLDAAIGGPLTDNILGRFAVESINRSGYGTNVSTGNEIDDDHRWAARGQLQFDVSDSANLLVSAEYGREKDASGLFTYYSPLYVVNTTAFPPPANGGAKGVGGFSAPDSRNGAGNIDPEFERETRAVTGTFTWDINSSLTLKDIVAWRDLHYFLAQDLDLSAVVPTPLTSTATVSIPMYDRQLSNELQLSYTGDRLSLIGGLYWFSETLSGTTFVGQTPTQGVWFARAGTSDGDSYAAFFNANFKIFDPLTLRVGGRYNRDKRSIENTQTISGVTTIPAIANTSRTDNKYTGEYGLDFHLTDRAMLYYTFSQGYRQGAAVIMQTTNPIIDPTTVDNNEVGFKFDTAGGVFGVDLAVYKMKIKNLQRTQAVPQSNGGFLTIINNINGMEVKGVELNSRWKPAQSFLLSGGVAYTDAKFLDYQTDDPLQFGNLLQQLAGNTPQLTSKWKGNLAAEYSIPLSNGKEVVIGANGSYVGKQYFDEFNRAPLVGDDYTQWGANLAYQPTARDWSVSLWGKNLGNDKQFADMTFSALGGVISKKFINPRTYGASINYQF
jgi:iron complex outermembrane receptor protein